MYLLFVSEQQHFVIPSLISFLQLSIMLTFVSDSKSISVILKNILMNVMQALSNVKDQDQIFLSYF